MNHARAPLAVRNVADVQSLLLEDPCDEAHILGSFWPHSRASFESHVVKGFKECVPVCEFEPHISALAAFYAQQILRSVQNDDSLGRFDWVVRVLGSAETRGDRLRPLALVVDALCRLTGARDATHLFFRSQSRPPMRVVQHLCGSEAIKARLRYVVQDLFICPAELGGTALLVDDIANTGASMRVYAEALKSCAGIERVVAVNLAATRFAKGKDGHGMLVLNTSELDSHSSLRRVYLDSSNTFHILDACPAIKPPISHEMRFLAERKGRPCRECCLESKSRRKWWQRL